MEPIRSIAALPFRRREALDLLDLRVRREAPNADYTGFGHALADEVVLEERDGGARVVREALLLAVHTAEDPEELPGDLELEFFVPEVGPDYSVTVLLSAFLHEWLPRVRGGESAIVLVVCNPLAARIARPEAAGATPFHHPLGDVEAWLAIDHGRQAIHLVADRWCVA
jgi:hypothetical protein